MVFTLFPADEDKKKQEQLLMAVKGEMQDETQRQLSKICLESWREVKFKENQD